MDAMTRRKFFSAATTLGASLAAAAAAAEAGDKAEFAIEDQQPFSGQTRRLKVTAGDRYVTSLIFPTEYPTHFRLKPELYPVCTPGGVPVTDSHQYCFIHHQSVMCGHGKVRVEGREKNIDFYRKLDFPEEARSDRWHRGFNLFHMGPSGIQRITEARWTAGGKAVIDLTLEWQVREFDSEEPGETILVEKRRYEIARRGAMTSIDHFSELVPAGPPAVLLADRHSFCGVRVHDLIDVEDGGTMRDSEGRVNPSGNYWDPEGDRKAPRWVDCSGKIGGSEAGVTLMGHPKNLRNQYYVREFGLMEVSAMLGEDVAVTKEEPFRFAARYLAHDGALDAEGTEEAWRDFAGKPIVPPANHAK